MDNALATGAGTAATVRVFDGRTGVQVSDGYVFDTAFMGGVSVAAADLTGDGKADLAVGAGPGGGPHVRVIDLTTLQSVPGPLGSFFAFEPGFAGGVHVGADWKAGDVTGDGRADLLVGSGAGHAPVVKVYSGRTGIREREFAAFDAGMTAGVRVAAAYITDDAYADVVASTGPGAAGRVRVFDGKTSRPVAGAAADFAPFGAGWTGGVALAASNDPPSSPPPAPPPPPTPPPTSPQPVLSADGDSLTLDADWPEAALWAGTMVRVKTVVSGLNSDTAPLRFDYYLHNVDVQVQSSTPPYNYYGLFDFVAPTANLTVLSQGNDRGWGQTAGPSQAEWYVVSESRLDTTVMPGGDAHFWLTSTRGPVVVSGGRTWEWTYNGPASRLTLGEGPKPTVGIQAADLIPVNANNDNFQPVYSTDTLHEVVNEADRWKSDDLPYIPKVRDFAATHLWQDDPQLLPVTLTVSGNLAGTLSAQVTGVAGGGVGRLWKNARKNEAFTSIDLPALAAGVAHPPVVVYLEGAHESKALDDVKVEAKFATVGWAVPATPKTVSVTPVVMNPTKKPTNLKIGPGFGGYVIVASDPANAPDTDVTFGYAAFMTGDQSGGFLQDVLSVVNGAVWGGHGIEGPLYSADFLLDPNSGGSLPLLNHTNANQAALDPRYPLVTVQQIAPVFASYKATDAPFVGTDEVTWKNLIEVVDITHSFRMHMAVRYTDGSIYTFRYINWHVVFAADTPPEDLSQGRGPRRLAAGAGVFLDQAWTVSNADPQKTAIPIANDAMRYVVTLNGGTP